VRKLLKMKKRTYKLGDISYRNLSMSYILIIVVTTITMLALTAMYAADKNWPMMAVVPSIGSSIIYMVYTTGVKYGQYGLEILLGKMLQPRRLKNDFPLISKHIVIISPDGKDKEPE